jgi:hypothetical protein
MEEFLEEQVPLATVLAVAIILVAAALLLLVLGERAAEGRLARNYTMGIRIRSTLASDDAWLAGHQAARLPTDIGAIGLGLSGVLAVLLQGSSVGFVATVLAGAAWLFIWIFIGAKRADRAAKAVAAGEVA